LALQEATEIDHRYGRIMNPDLQHYHVPVNADSHAIETLFVEEEDRIINSLGVKGIGGTGDGGHPRGHRERGVSCDGEKDSGVADYGGEGVVEGGD